MGDNSIRFLTTSSPVPEFSTGSTVAVWLVGENGSENLELEHDRSRAILARDSDAAAVFGLISADGDKLNGRAPSASQLTLVGLDLWDWDLVILLPRGVGRKERRFCPLALSDFLFKTLLGTVNRLKDSTVTQVNGDKSWLQICDHSTNLKGAVSQGFCCFGSILCWNPFLEALIINKMLLCSYDKDIKWIISEMAIHNKVLEDFWNT